MSLLSLLIAGIVCHNAVKSEIVSIVASNHDQIMQNSRMTFVSFTASWCPFSSKLLSTFNQSSLDYKSKYPEKKTIWGNVDCVVENGLCEKYLIDKFPTLKVFFYGQIMAEYRGGRQSEALIEYVEKMENTAGLVRLKEAESLTQWQDHVDARKGTLILWFPRNSPPFELILKAIALIHDRLTVVVPVESNFLDHEQHQLWFSADGKHVQEFEGSVTNFKEILEWVKEKSVGMVRELTYSNAEEMVEEKKPLLILFTKKGDSESEKNFVEAIRRELDQKSVAGINPLIADGEAMLAALQQLRKTVDDLPFLIIDQFIHVYQAPWKGEAIFDKGNIKQFVADLYNNSHHNNLHKKVNELLQKILSETENLEKEMKEDGTKGPEGAEKQASVFKKLEPAVNRYSFAKQEL